MLGMCKQVNNISTPEQGEGGRFLLEECHVSKLHQDERRFPTHFLYMRYFRYMRYFCYMRYFRYVEDAFTGRTLAVALLGSLFFFLENSLEVKCCEEEVQGLMLQNSSAGGSVLPLKGQPDSDHEPGLSTPRVISVHYQCLSERTGLELLGCLLRS